MRMWVLEHRGEGGAARGAVPVVRQLRAARQLPREAARARGGGGQGGGPARAARAAAVQAGGRVRPRAQQIQHLPVRALRLRLRLAALRGARRGVPGHAQAAGGAHGQRPGRVLPRGRRRAAPPALQAVPEGAQVPRRLPVGAVRPGQEVDGGRGGEEGGGPAAKPGVHRQEGPVPGRRPAHVRMVAGQLRAAAGRRHRPAAAVQEVRAAARGAAPEARGRCQARPAQEAAPAAPGRTRPARRAAPGGTRRPLRLLRKVQGLREAALGWRHVPTQGLQAGQALRVRRAPGRAKEQALPQDRVGDALGPQRPGGLPPEGRGQLGVPRAAGPQGRVGQQERQVQQGRLCHAQARLHHLLLRRQQVAATRSRTTRKYCTNRLTRKEFINSHQLISSWDVPVATLAVLAPLSAALCAVDGSAGPDAAVEKLSHENTHELVLVT